MREHEGATVEYKRAYSKGVVETVVAFANSDGGTLLIGIDDNGVAVGVDDVDGTMLQVTNSVRDSVRPDVTMFTSARAEQIDGKDIVRVEVQRGPSRPYYLASQGIRVGGVLVRQGASSVPASEGAIKRMIAVCGGERFEQMRAIEQGLSFATAASMFEGEGLAFGAAQHRTLGIVGADGLFTNTGLILSDQCPYQVKVAVFADGHEETFEDRRVFSGSVLQQASQAYEFLDLHNPISSRFEGLKRRDFRRFPEAAVREALLNALVHRDYAFDGPTLVNVYGTRMEFVSLGGLVEGLELEDLQLGVSLLRNHDLAEVFYRLNLIEAYGTGIRKIMSAYEEAAAKPEMTASPNAFKIVLPELHVTAASMGATQIEQEERWHIESGLDTPEERVYTLLLERGSLKRVDVEQQLGVGRTKAGRILDGLEEAGRIVARGSGRSTYYVAAS